jgi:hypothetical protein
MRLPVRTGTTVKLRNTRHGGDREMSAVLSNERSRQRTERRRQPDEAVEVLREVWSATGQSLVDLEEAFGTQKSCKRMQDVGFDDMAGEAGDLRSAWRATLEREGKLNSGGGSVGDLVLGSGKSSG